MPYLYSETRAEMRQALDEFRKEAAAAKKIDGYQEYSKAMEDLDLLMTGYIQTDSFGLPKKFTAQDREKLLAAMKKTALAGETYLKNAKEKARKDPSIKLNSGVPAMTAKLQGLLARDHQTISEYDPAKEKSLAQLLDESRTVTVDVKKSDLKRVGASLSSRMAVNVDNGKGGKHAGIFTEAKHMNFMKSFNAAIENTCKVISDPADKKAVKSFFRQFKKFICDKDARAKRLTDEYLANKLVRTICKEEGEDGGGNSYDKTALKNLMKRVGIDTSKMRESTFRALGESLQRLNDGVDNVNIVKAGLKDGDRIDAANTGMSAVATLLGKPSLVAKSVNMNMRDENGNTVNGTFMDYSSGLNLNEQDMSDFRALSNEPFKGTEGQLIRQLADIQVLDYICGNVDRHYGNLTFQVKEQGKIIGIQGIDNDCSFGRKLDMKERTKELPGINNMNFISKSMADKITALDPSMLRFTLRGRGLNDEQIDYAAERLIDIQNAIKEGQKHYGDKRIKEGEKAFDKGYLRTVEDEDFAKLTMQNAYQHGKTAKTTQYNLFNEVDEWVNKRLAVARREGYNYDPDYIKSGITTGSGGLSENYYKAKDLKKATKGSDALVKKGEFDVDKLTDGNRGTQQFADMVTASKKLNELNKEFSRLIKKGEQLTALDYEKYYRRLSDAVEELDSTSDIYLSKKMRERKAANLGALRGKNQYEQKRIDYAKQAAAFAKESLNTLAGLVKPPKELSEQEKKDYRTITERRELEDRRAALEALKKLHAEKGLEDPEKKAAAQQAERNKAAEASVPVA